MEKFSTWRDASSGVAPFVLPVPTGDDSSTPLLLVAKAVLSVFAVVRIAIFFLLVGLFVGLDSAFSLIAGAAPPSLASWMSFILAQVLLRPCLFLCFGYFYINEEQASTRRRTAASGVTPPAAGDLIVSNWSSFVDVLYLTCRYAPAFLIPVTGTNGGRPVKYVPKTMLGAIAMTGHVLSPEEHIKAETLDSIVAKAHRPLVIFSEGTTSNNRAILRFTSDGALPRLPERTKVYLHVLKHEGPSTFRPTVTSPIPSRSGNPLPQVFRACLSPLVVPRHLLVRMLPPTEAPPISAANFWRQAAESMCTMGKLKQTNLGAEEKVSFLEYYFRTGPKSREPVTKSKKRK